MKETYTIIPAKERFLAQHGWLQSYHLFSFADYYDKTNISFWNLRVFNDDYIAWNSGFALHPHDNMEILTIVLDGSITHTDSLWNKEKTRVWELQTMSAWTGIFHAEMNEEPSPLHLYQLWFFPIKKDVPPCYTNKKVVLKNNALNLLFWKNEPNPLNTDILVYRWLYKKGKSFEYTIKKWRGLFLYVHTGKIEIDTHTLSEWDQIRIYKEWVYTFSSLENITDCIVIEVAF